MFLQNILNFFVFIHKPEDINTVDLQGITRLGDIPILIINVESPRAVILYFHGNGENIFDIRERLKFFAKELNCSIVSYDYAGYGIRPGYSNERGIYEDSLKIYKYTLDNFAGGDHSKIVLMGKSVGSAPAIYVAAKHQGIRCVVLISPFASILQTKFNVPFYFDIFRNDKYIRYIKAPVLILHGKKDIVVPPSLKLFNLIKPSESSKIVIYAEGTHTNLYTGSIGEKVIEEINHFI